MQRKIGSWFSFVTKTKYSELAWICIFCIINIAMLCKIELVSSAEIVKNLIPTEVVYAWRDIDFNFKSSKHRKQMIDQKQYIVNHVGIAGVKISGDRMFISIGRFIPGVPVTLAEIPYNFSKVSDFDGIHPNGPLLNPFPNWEMQEVGNCEAFQLVQSMEIDQFNRLWVVDMGKSDILGNIRADCHAKLIVYDLNKGDRVIRKYLFPFQVIPLADGATIEIVVGCLSEVDCKAYIADINKDTVIVYNFKENTSWVVKHSSMKREEGSEKITVLGKPFRVQLGVDGMALSPKSTNFDTLYYTPLAGYNTYSVATSTLDWAKNHNNGQLPDDCVTNIKRRHSITDGFAMDSKGRLFWGANEHNSIYVWQTPSTSVPNSTERIQITEKLVAKNDADLIWSDSFGFDQRGYLLVVVNAFHLAPLDYDRSKINFKIVRIFVGTRSYAYDS